MVTGVVRGKARGSGEHTCKQSMDRDKGQCCGSSLLPRDHMRVAPSPAPSMTVTGKTLGENLASCPDLSAGQKVILPMETPIKPTGHIQILYGNLAPGGSGERHTQ